MHVRFLGFDLSVGDLTIAEFITFLSGLHEREFEHSGEKRLVYVADNQHYHIGLLLTIRDQRKFCELQSQPGHFKLSVRELKEKTRMADFNFFAINKITHKGLYQHYRGACGLTAFSNLLRRKYNQAINEARLATLPTGQARLSASQKKKARQQIKGTLTLTAMYKREDFDELVKQMKNVQTLAFDCVTLANTEASLTPASQWLTKERHIFSFSKDGALNTIKRAILQLAKKDTYHQVSVSGHDPTGDPVTYHIDENLNHFGKFDFDDITNDEALDVSDIAKSPIVKKLFAAIKDNDLYFG